MKWIAVITIAAIFILEVLALCKGVNGVALSGAIAAIAGVGGYQIKAIIERRKK